MVNKCEKKLHLDHLSYLELLLKGRDSTFGLACPKMEGAFYFGETDLIDYAKKYRKECEKLGFIPTTDDVTIGKAEKGKVKPYINGYEVDKAWCDEAVKMGLASNEGIHVEPLIQPTKTFVKAMHNDGHVELALNPEPAPVWYKPKRIKSWIGNLNPYSIQKPIWILAAVIWIIIGLKHLSELF